MAKDKVLVPSPNWSNSNTPTGPFQIIVLASFKYSAKALAVSGPISKIISSASTSSTLLRVATAVSENSLPQTTSVGNGIDTFSMSFLAAGIKSSSYNDLPTGLPAAAKKVFAIPPPTMIWSHISDKDSNTSNLVDTLEPPTMATSGRAGLSKALPNASNSFANNGPAHATGANLATPCVEACARCAVPKASITNMSHKAA